MNEWIVDVFKALGIAADAYKQKREEQRQEVRHRAFERELERIRKDKERRARAAEEDR